MAHSFTLIPPGLDQPPPGPPCQGSLSTELQCLADTGTQDADPNKLVGSRELGTIARLWLLELMSTQVSNASRP